MKAYDTVIPALGETVRVMMQRIVATAHYAGGVTDVFFLREHVHSARGRLTCRGVKIPSAAAETAVPGAEWIGRYEVPVHAQDVLDDLRAVCGASVPHIECKTRERMADGAPQWLKKQVPSTGIKVHEGVRVRVWADLKTETLLARKVQMGRRSKPLPEGDLIYIGVFEKASFTRADFVRKAMEAIARATGA